MKYTLSILMIALFAQVLPSQNQDYDELWRKVDSLELEGLPKNALDIVNDIEKKAEIDKNESQKIKVLLFQSKFSLLLEEESRVRIVDNFKKAIATSQFPESNLLHNLLAQMYWDYFQDNRWRFYDRSNTQAKVDDDFRTWDLITLFNEIGTHFKISLRDKDRLQQLPISHFDVLINKRSDSEKYRPTVFDLLAQNALTFYSSKENSISKPAYKFEIDVPALIDDSNTFAQLEITTEDQESLQLQALELFQELIAFHQSKQNKEALTDVNIQRLLYVYRNATFNNKDELLIATLQKEFSNSTAEESDALYRFEIAQKLYDQGATYQNTRNDVFRWKKKEAKEICNDIIKSFPKSEAAKKSKSLIEYIEQKSLSLKTATHIPIGKPSKLLVTYANLDKLNFQVLKIDTQTLRELRNTNDHEEIKKIIKSLKEIHKWRSELRNEEDFQEHSTEIVIPALDNGLHIIVATGKIGKEKVFAYDVIQATNLALVDRSANGQYVYQIINRKDGTPIEGAKVRINYYQRQRGNMLQELTSDAFGMVKFKESNGYYRVEFVVEHKDDVAEFGNVNMYNRWREWEDDKTTSKTFLFTDRSIYRPGQIVYFKGIALQSSNGKSELLTNTQYDVSLMDVNGELIEEVEVVTNEFGSFNGQFILPQNTLNGQFRLTVENFSVDAYDQHYFSVEEYKRPKFKVSFNPLKGTYKLNDSISLNGLAQAFAGSNITNAQVTYRVSREVQFPRWYFYSRPWFSSEPQEIAHGTTHSDENGAFQIQFLAQPDRSVPRDNQPTFRYKIVADVTDINGETRSATNWVNVGYHALTFQLSVDALLDKNKSDHSISIITNNLNGEFVPTNGKVKIFKLQGPADVLRKRPWSAPDYQNLSNEDFKSLFPNEAYSNEDDVNFWDHGQLVFEQNYDNRNSKEVNLGSIENWNSGKYKLIVESTDEFGQQLNEHSIFEVYSENDLTLADQNLFQVKTDKISYAPGDVVKLKLGSAGKMTVTVDVEKKYAIVSSEIVTLDNEIKELEIPISNDDLGGFVVHYNWAAYNSFESKTININVPYPLAELQVETKTFRDKLDPGQKEVWEFKIKGPKGEKTSAEILASMYDASLDQFKLHQWDFDPDNKMPYRSFNRRTARQSFGSSNFRSLSNFNTPSSIQDRLYDGLNWFGFYFAADWRYHDYLAGLRQIKNRDKIYAEKDRFDYNRKIKRGTVEGTISDVVGPLPGVNVMIEGTTIGTTTDFDGRFSINVKRGQTLIFSYVGYETRRIKVKKKNQFYLIMQEDVDLLQEVVVVGSMSKRGMALGAVSDVAELEESAPATMQLNSEEFENDNAMVKAEPTPKTELDKVIIRKNLQETAFFYPDLKTDKDGNISFEFTTPEALTTWKLQLLAHNKSLESTVAQFEAVTQKELMVIPNPPRFLREGDEIVFSSKIANLSDKLAIGVAELQLQDALTGKNVNALLHTTPIQKDFEVSPNGNASVSWSLQIPETIQAIQYQVIAKTGDVSDGEQNVLPVLTNRMLVTESLPMWVKSNETRNFRLDKLRTSNSSTLKHQKLTLEFSSNPAWYAVQSLPYLMEYPYECNEQIFSRYYANALATFIANSNPRIKAVFDQWSEQDVLVSNLEKNQELKSLLIQETPWVREAQSEAEQKKRIALLFDLNKMSHELRSSLNKLRNNQYPNGAWPWFKGGRENRWITQHIVSGFAHLDHLEDFEIPQDARYGLQGMLNKAMKYLDKEFMDDYKELKKHQQNNLTTDHLNSTQLQYLYIRSFKPEIALPKNVQEALDFYKEQIRSHWLKKSLYQKGLMALIMHRYGDQDSANKILESLKQFSITSEEMGMYWKENTNSWFWFKAPIETQALLIEAFSEIENDQEIIDNMKIWLLKNKQTNSWKTTKATTKAIYALLHTGSDWLSVSEMVDIKIGGNKLDLKDHEEQHPETATGYFKTSWVTDDIKKEMADVTISKTGNGIAWGGLYWQYFEDLDKITSAETPLKLSKRLFRKDNTDKGEVLKEINGSTALSIGDIVRVRIELRSDRDMEFIHMKDMRASGLEPINVISQYKWQDGLGYYESTKDASTNFFFDFLPKGVYVFEYDLRVNNSGDFSNGITSIQSMYAPEFSSHSEGVRLRVD